MRINMIGFQQAILARFQKAETRGCQGGISREHRVAAEIEERAASGMPVAIIVLVEPGDNVPGTTVLTEPGAEIQRPAEEHRTPLE
jgi:hypothetical protein